MVKPAEPIPSYGIETKYRGIVFRSRCEAQWAAYFDLLGFEWEYEPNGERTFPDFKVMVGTNTQHVEVKGALDRTNTYDPKHPDEWPIPEPSYYGSGAYHIGHKAPGHQDVLTFLRSLEASGLDRTTVILACKNEYMLKWIGGKWEPRVWKRGGGDSWARAGAMLGKIKRGEKGLE